MRLTLEQIEFCAAECARQESGELSVAAMCRALCYMSRMNQPLTETIIRAIAQVIEPKTNGDYRIVPVSKSSGTVIGVPALQVPRSMSNLTHAIVGGRVSAFEAYKEFELIHPFVDGNGRVGALIFNFMLHSLDHPSAPPNIFPSSKHFSLDNQTRKS